MAYLKQYGEFWNSVLPEEDHQHEVGEEKGHCMNCILDKLANEMSAFEVACWNWYQENVSQFAFKAVVVADLIRGMGLQGAMQRMFVRALGFIDATTDRIVHEMSKPKEENG